MTTYSSILIWKIPWTEESGGLPSMRSQKIQTQLINWKQQKIENQKWTCVFASAEYIMSNAGPEEAQAEIKIARRNINNLRYADDTTLMAESEEELKSLLMKVEVESEKVGLKSNSQKTKITASGPITSWEMDGETVSDFILGGSKNTADGDCSHEISLLLGSYDRPR